MVSRARKVVWSKGALADNKHIADYWNNRNKSKVYSRKLYKLFVQKMSNIARQPYIGRETNALDVRTVVVRDNLLVYKILDDKIIVLSIWEGHQNPEKFNY